MADDPPIDLDARLRQVQRAGRSGQNFLAYDLAISGLREYPANSELEHEAVKALIALGSVEDARRMVEAALLRAGVDANRLQQLAAGGRKLAEHDRVHAPSPDGDQRALTESLGLLGRVLKDLWRSSRSSDILAQCKQAYMAAFGASNGYWACINVATLSRAWAALDYSRSLEELKDAKLFATACIRLCDAALAPGSPPALAAAAELRSSPAAGGEDVTERFWILATRGEAALVLKDEQAAIAAYTEAAQLRTPDLRMRQSVRRQLDLLRECGLKVPAAIASIFRPPAVICFTGHRIDGPDRATPRFPGDAEPAVKEAIAAALDGINNPHLIGYCSAASGSDILFAEAMLKRDADLEIVLPFDRDDFFRTSVAPAGPEWVRRFNELMADEKVNVSYATEEPYFQTEGLFDFCNRLLAGAARRRAASLQTRPQLLAVVDPHGESDGPYGALDVLDQWDDEKIVIDLAAIRAERPESAGHAVATSVGGAPASAVMTVDGQRVERDVRFLMFADVRGFSHLAASQVPLFMYRFLRRVAAAWEAADASRPLLVETWGDAVYCVMPTAWDALVYALALQRVTSRTNWTDLGLPGDLAVRVSLHAGPLFEGLHPLTDKPTFFGTNATRAARIEPITLPGQIYGTLQFVSALLTEPAAAAASPKDWPFHCDYMGKIALAKAYDTVPLFRIQGTKV